MEALIMYKPGKNPNSHRQRRKYNVNDNFFETPNIINCYYAGFIAAKIKNKNRVVADFGCGENLMKTFIPNNKVYSFDHIANDDTVIACDMSHTPLEDESIDIAVFSLALWGSNFEDYFKEAYRLLNYDGLMYIAEPSKSYNIEQRNELIEMLKNNGFTPVGEIEDRGKFFYITVIKK